MLTVRGFRAPVGLKVTLRVQGFRVYGSCGFLIYFRGFFKGSLWVSGASLEGACSFVERYVGYG